MNLLPLIDSAENIKLAIDSTAEASERQELESVLTGLHNILRRHGLFYGYRPRAGQTNIPPGGAAPGSTTKS